MKFPSIERWRNDSFFSYLLMNSEKCLNITQRHFHILSYKIKHVNVSLVNFEARLLRGVTGDLYLYV